MPEPKTKDPVHYWWHGRDLKDFLCEIQQRGADNVRVEFHPETGLLHVVPEKEGDVEAEASRAARRTFDFVHTCPPTCH